MSATDEEPMTSLNNRNSRASANKAKKSVADTALAKDSNDLSFEDSEDDYVPASKKRRAVEGSDTDSEPGKPTAVTKSRKVANHRVRSRREPPNLKLIKVDGFSSDQIDRKLRAWIDPKAQKCSFCVDPSACTLSTLVAHLRDVHQVELEDYKETTGESLETEDKCELCKQNVTRSPDGLKQHFVKWHQGYTLKKYFRTFILPTLPFDFAEEEASKKTCAILPETLKLLAVNDYPSDREENELPTSAKSDLPVTRDFCRLCGEVVKQDVESLKTHYETGHATEKDKLVRAWSQQVTFHPCVICGVKAETMRDVKEHTSRKHGISIHDYITEHARESGIFDKPPIRHACVVCYQSVLHDRGHLTKHFMERCTKKLTLAAYFDRHISQSKGPYVTKPSSVQTSYTRREPVSHKIDPEVQEACKKWRFMCVWECRQCPETKEQFCQIKQHMKDAHQASTPAMKTVEGTQTHVMAKKAVLHPCGLCGTKLLQEHSFLAPHFTNEHKMDVIIYFEKHVYDPDTM